MKKQFRIKCIVCFLTLVFCVVLAGCGKKVISTEEINSTAEENIQSELEYKLEFYAQNEAIIRESPSEKGIILAALSENELIYIQEYKEGWVNCKLSNGIEGYVFNTQISEKKKEKIEGLVENIEQAAQNDLQKEEKSLLEKEKAKSEGNGNSASDGIPEGEEAMIDAYPGKHVIVNGTEYEYRITNYYADGSEGGNWYACGGYYGQTFVAHDRYGNGYTIIPGEKTVLCDKSETVFDEETKNYVDQLSAQIKTNPNRFCEIEVDTLEYLQERGHNLSGTMEMLGEGAGTKGEEVWIENPEYLIGFRSEVGESIKYAYEYVYTLGEVVYSFHGSGPRLMLYGNELVYYCFN